MPTSPPLCIFCSSLQLVPGEAATPTATSSSKAGRTRFISTPPPSMPPLHLTALPTAAHAPWENFDTATVRAQQGSPCTTMPVATPRVFSTGFSEAINASRANSPLALFADGSVGGGEEHSAAKQGRGQQPQQALQEGESKGGVSTEPSPFGELNPLRNYPFFLADEPQRPGAAAAQEGSMQAQREAMANTTSIPLWEPEFTAAGPAMDGGQPHASAQEAASIQLPAAECTTAAVAPAAAVPLAVQMEPIVAWERMEAADRDRCEALFVQKVCGWGGGAHPPWCTCACMCAKNGHVCTPQPQHLTTAPIYLSMPALRVSCRAMRPWAA